MAFLDSSAGVYDRDLDGSIRGSQVSSSVGAIVIEAQKGDTRNWVRVTDTGDLKTKFGIKDISKYAFGMHCAEHTLAETVLWVKRAVDSATARTAGAYLSVDDLGATEPVIKLVNFDNGTNQPQGVLGDPLTELGFVVGTPGVSNALLFICANSPGEWSKAISVRVRPANPEGTEIGAFNDPTHFYIDVFLNYSGNSSVPVESFLCSRKYELDGEQNQMYVEQRVNTFSKYIKVKNNQLCPAVEIRTTAFERLDGGEDGNRPSESQIIAAWDGIEDTDQYDVQLLIGAGYETPAIQRHMVSIAEKRGDAIPIMDLPYAYEEVSRAVNYRRNILNVNSSYGTLYGPRGEVTDDVTGRRFMCPVSGMVAAAYAYTDRVRKYYWAPAGLDRGQVKVTGLSKKYNLQERNALEQAQINYIRRIPGRGYVIMEQNTLQAFPSHFQNVNVRRLVNGIKAMVRKSFLPSVFNPNNDFERKKLKNLVDTEARVIKRNRGLTGWATICDTTNNTPDVIANNDMKLDFVLDPSIPAKRVSLTADIRNFGSSIDFQEG
ncbi:tail sheath [Pseudomonas phage Lu11]|uniref:tail sheath n=1 Tax=Pseudomonas phage Lu11 TaxID=1161927 RepID=UPI00025F152C|nr:tail sheath [Pseudomonas phage Lu11]AFH14613.1 putative tail sheath protein [Pseudomonas phage Lu11]